MRYIFAALFFASALVSIFWGLKIIKLNIKSNINRTFLLICIALSIWSFGFSMASLSQKLGTALLWRRFSAVGWTSIFSIILHYLILITNQKDNIKYNKYLFLLHIPAMINMYIFAISKNMAIVQYNLVKIDYGWTNIAVNNGWDYFYYLYYSLYMISSIIIAWKWKIRIKEKIKIRQAKFIFGAIVSAAILGSLTDLVASTFSTKPLPQMAPLFILLPVWSLFYPARYHELVNYEKKSTKEIIITEEDKKDIFNKLSLAFYIASIFGFLVEYISYRNNKDALKTSLLNSIILIGLGIIIRGIQKIKNQSLKENLTIITLVLSIPIVLLQYLKYGSVTVWAFPMVIMISSIIFGKQILLISTTIVAISTQILIWILRPEVTVVINKYDYILRIGIFGMAFLTGLFINKIYLAKIKENKFQARFQNMNARISSDFITINKENIDVKINKMLLEMGLFFWPDRISLFLINYEDGMITYSHEWCDKGIDSQIESFKNLRLLNFTWWTEELNKNQLVSIGDTRKMPKEAINEQKQLNKLNIKSVVSVPVKGKNRMKAFMVISSINSYRKWPEDDVKLLHILANLLSDALLRIESEKEIEYMAYYDNLTKLPNRFLFSNRVNKAIDLAGETGKNIGIIFIDLDNFKLVNDTMGHSSGDYLLKKVAETLSEFVEKDDTACRSGGDEFMIMLNNMGDKNEIIRIVEKLMDLFLQPFNINQREIVITASVGVSIYPMDGEDSEILAQNADLAMYQAKEMGKNQYVLCTTHIKQEVQMNMKLSNDMYQALQRDEFVVYYQPQVDLDTGIINGLEALLRWNHPEKGMISPAVFIPLAEKNGMISSIGEWVLRTACTQSKKWIDMGFSDLSIAVNLSAVQLLDPNIDHSVESILKETDLNPEYLELEITESIAIKQEAHAEEILNKLKKIGICIAIDDFGTEYSSLSRLKTLPINRIKIDMQFTQGIESSEKDRAIIMVIITLAKRLGMTVIAEGAETKDQIEFLQKHLCDDVQGYYYYKPMVAEEIEKLLMDKKLKGIEKNEKKTNKD